jgi:hypothetical protein
VCAGGGKPDGSDEWVDREAKPGNVGLDRGTNPDDEGGIVYLEVRV